MDEFWTRTRGEVIAFPDASSRPNRLSLTLDEPKGEILLFTGVRYERPAPSPGPSRPLATHGSGRSRRS